MSDIKKACRDLLAVQEDMAKERASELVADPYDAARDAEPDETVFADRLEEDTCHERLGRMGR